MGRHWRATGPRLDPPLWLLAVAYVIGLIVVFALAAIALLFVLSAVPAKAHDWYPPQCCSGHDCRVIDVDDVKLTPLGFEIKESGEVISYSDNRIRKTPPEGAAKYHRCSEGGKAAGKTICIYIPNWQF